MILSMGRNKNYQRHSKRSAFGVFKYMQIVKMIASFDALQGTDSLGTSTAPAEKELIKAETIDLMDMFDFFIICTSVII